MGTKLFKNTEDKVLMSASGKLIKQNYGFGNAFQNRLGLNNYIKFDLTGVAQYYNIFVCSRHIGYSYAVILVSLNNTNNDHYNFEADYAGALNVGIQKNALSGNSMQFHPMIYTFTPLKTIWLGCYIGATVPYSLYLGTGEYTQSTTVETNNYPLSSGWIGAASDSNGTLPSVYASPTLTTYNRLLLIDRKWSFNEFKYLYNNGSGNDPQSNVGIIVDIICNFAEILDFSALQNGSDMRVGCRDYSGYHRHGEIMNLPAGDLTQKLNFANANLFVPFIS